MTPETVFAPAGRADKETVLRQSQRLLDVKLLAQLYDCVSEVIFVLNAQRQIIFCNRNLVEMLGLPDSGGVLGLRPGEAMSCVHACKCPGGCGASEFCSACGAVQAILSSQAGQEAVKECSVTRTPGGDALDLRVRASPLLLEGETYTLCAVTDISHERRRRALERVFFHDVMNTLSGLKMLANLLPTAKPDRHPQMSEDIRHGIGQLLEEIVSQRDLMSAENQELTVQAVNISARPFLEDLLEMYGHFGALKDCPLRLDDSSHDVTFKSDHLLLSRVLGNMLKNAVEACQAGQTVTAGCDLVDATVHFWVHNPGEIPRAVQLQLFQRSFSTKGAGRGLGTYSMRLLTERYLKGHIAVQSSATQGTTFTATYPLCL